MKCSFPLLHYSSVYGHTDCLNFWSKPKTQARVIRPYPLAKQQLCHRILLADCPVGVLANHSTNLRTVPICAEDSRTLLGSQGIDMHADCSLKVLIYTENIGGSFDRITITIQCW